MKDQIKIVDDLTLQFRLDLKACDTFSASFSCFNFYSRRDEHVPTPLRKEIYFAAFNTTSFNTTTQPKTLFSRIKLDWEHPGHDLRPFRMDIRADIHYYDTMTLYIASRSIDISGIEESDFHRSANLIEDFGKSPSFKSDKESDNVFWLWIEA